MEIHLRTTGCRLSYEIVQCYLLPGDHGSLLSLFVLLVFTSFSLVIVTVEHQYKQIKNILLVLSCYR